MALRQLPPEIKVLGINDYIFLDGYKHVVAAKQRGELPNIDLILPVIELRLDKFGGTKNHLSRVNYHVIFSDELPPDVIETQFISPMCTEYILAPEYEDFTRSGQWAAAPTRASIEDLGRRIIATVPPAKRSDFGSPVMEGFSNLCFSLSHINALLARPHFAGRAITAVGKAEWANIKWTDQSIADKKTIINGVDLVFTAANSAAEWQKARESLLAAGVNARLLDCSDAHDFADSGAKDRLGNCHTWIKADPTFEGLRQAVFEYDSRVAVVPATPLQPLLQIKSATLTFPIDTTLVSDDHVDDFCFRGRHIIPFSPFLTCVIGGRGTGKSTLLNLIHERLAPGSTEFFRRNQLAPPDASIVNHVAIEGIGDSRFVEFLQQNEVEQFATHHQKLTDAVFARLRKMEGRDALGQAEAQLASQLALTQRQLERIKEHHRIAGETLAAEGELRTQRGLVDSFQSPEYRAISESLAIHERQLQALRASRERFEALYTALSQCVTDWTDSSSTVSPATNAYDSFGQGLVDILLEHLSADARQSALSPAVAEEARLIAETARLRQEIEAFLKDRGFSEENLSDVGRASEAIAALESRLDALRKRASQLATEIQAFVPDRSPVNAYREAIEQLLTPINNDLRAQGAEVKPIALEYDFDSKAFRQAMIRKLAVSIGDIDGRAPRPDYLEGRLEQVDFNALASKEETIAAVRDDGRLYSRRILDFLREGINFDVLRLEAEMEILNIRSFAKISVLYDGKALDRSSFGQRCTAVIVVLLLLGNMPIIIDEPEAHLDSSLIAKYLVALIKDRKKHRQVIFATHNANLVINGDADLVHCLHMGDDRESHVVSTTIEDLANRELLLALEGGEKAFQQRERRYGID